MNQTTSTQVEREEEQIWSWGAGTEGQLGTGRLEDELSPQLIQFPYADSITHLACGGAHTIALTSCGKVLTWGRGTSGQLGHGEMVNALVPKLVDSLRSLVVVHVAAGWNHSGFVTDTGVLYTCGDGSFGQLGHGDLLSLCAPKAVSYFSAMQVVQIACGMRHSIALVKDAGKGDKVFGVGSGKRGQLGVSVDKLRLVSEPCVTLGLENLQISSIHACGDHSAALSSLGEVYTWGRGFRGSLDVHIPRRINSGFVFTQVCLGWNHALFLTGDGEVFMLGFHRHENSMKHLSDKVSYNDPPLERVETGSMRVLQIASGAEHSALVTEGGEILTWGWGEHGQLGLGNTCDQPSPRIVRQCTSLTSDATVFRVYCGSGFTFVVGSFNRHTIRRCKQDNRSKHCTAPLN